MIYNKKPNRIVAFNEDCILPMIDVIFLMLIFFLIMAKFLPSDVKSTELMKINATDKLQNSEVILKINQDGTIIKNNQPINLHHLDVKQIKKINLVVDKRLNAKLFLKQLNKIKKFGITNIAIIVKNNGGNYDK